MKSLTYCSFALFVLIALTWLTTGCATNAPLSNLPSPSASLAPNSSAPVNNTSNSQSAVLLFDIGMHIEPFGAQVSSIVTGQNAPVSKPPAQNQAGENQASYYNTQFFQSQVKDILAVASIVEKHAGRMTVQAQTPFTTIAAKAGNTLLADLEARGHEIGLHFHEDAHLGKNADALSPNVWCAVFKEEINAIHSAGVKDAIRYWSGGNLYSHLLDAATCAGMNVNSDWKNPQEQATVAALIGIHPWRPAGSSNGNDVSQFAKNDPNGKIIFLPEGLYARNDFASMRRSDNAGGDEAYFQFLKTSLLDSLNAAEPGKVNVFHFTVHPGEFRGDAKNPFGVIDRFLTEVVDPLVKQGKVQWATYSEMADAYAASGK